MELMRELSLAPGVSSAEEEIAKIITRELKDVADKLRDKLVSGVIVLANTAEDKVNFVVTATEDVVKKGIHSGNIVKEVATIAGGKGGGRPNMAQAGAPDITKVDEALNHASEVVEAQVK